MGKYDNVPEADAVINYILNLWKRGLLVVVKVYGAPGTGKSYLCRRIMEKLSMKIYGKNVSGMHCVVDSLLGILDFIKIPNPIKFLTIEEVAAIFPSRRAMSTENVVAGKVFDTLRKKGVIILLNFPVNKSIDGHIDGLCNLSIETLSLNKKEKVCVAKPMRLQINYSTGKVYHHKLTNSTGGNVDRCIFRMPDAETNAEYEETKDDYLNNLYKRESLRVKKKIAKEDKELGIKPDVQRPLSKRQLQVYDLRYGQGMKYKDISSQLKISISRVGKIMLDIGKKTKKPPKDSFSTGKKQ